MSIITTQEYLELEKLSKQQRYRNSKHYYLYHTNPQYKKRYFGLVKMWHYKNKERVKELHKKHNKEWFSNSNNRMHALMLMRGYKADVIKHYSNNQFKCVCCGVVGLPFLSIDHESGNGDADRARHHNNTGANQYPRIKHLGYPSGLQVLCIGCNWFKGRYGRCPHKQKLKNGRKYFEIERQKTLEFYGKKCVCCGEAQNEFLTIGGLDKESKKKKKSWRNSIFRYLCSHNYPKGFGVFCYNCAWIRSKTNQECPHNTQIKYWNLVKH